MPGAGRVEPWKVEEVRRYLSRHFQGGRVDDYPRGVIAHLFVVTESGLDIKKRHRHHLLITRQFFDRVTDPATLKDALDSADVSRALSRAGERSVDLY